MAPDELNERTAAFQHALAALEHPDRGDDDERQADRRLAALFAALVPRLAWDQIADHAAGLRAAGPRLPDTLRRLDAYEGYAAVRTGRYERGERLLADALAAGAQGEPRLVALNGMAQAHWFQTRYDQALAWFQRLADAARDAGDRTYEGVALINMGMVHNDLGRPERAIELTEQSLAIFRAAGDRAREANALYEIGNNAMLLGRWSMARDHIEQAIGLYELLGNSAPLPALLWARGYLAHLLGDERASEESYRHGLALAQRPGLAAPSVALDIHTHLGLLYQSQGRLADASGHYTRAAELADELKRAHWQALISHRLGAIHEREGRAEEAVAAYRRAIEGVEALRGAAEAEEVKLGLLGTAQLAFESIVLLLLALGRHEEAFHYVERARSRVFLDMLARQDPQLYERVDQPVATLAEVQAALRPGAVLLEYFTAGIVPRGEHLLNRIPDGNTRLRELLAPEPQTWIFAVTPGGLEAHRTALDPSTLRPQPGEPGPGRRLLQERLLATLYQRLVAPAAHLLQGCELLYLVPHGPLHYVPFMALRSPDGRHLLDRGGPAVAVAPSATVLLRSCLARPPRGAGPSLAIGYNDEGLAALSYAEAEARHVARLVGGAALHGPGAKVHHLAAAGPALRHLHIAGHATYHPHDPLASELRLGRGETLSARDIIGGVRVAAEIVTLSACTSGLSHVVAGDELMGLQRAFLFAGAPTVVCTLWEAADLVALLVMDRFYRAVLAGSAPAAALRDAQVALREMTGRELAETLDALRRADPALAALPEVPPEHYELRPYADPLYWAPFMLVGRPG